MTPVDVSYLEGLLPPLLRSDLNERTLFVVRKRWLEMWTERDIASECGWSIPAVQFHLRRAEEVLRKTRQETT